MKTLNKVIYTLSFTLLFVLGCGDDEDTIAPVDPGGPSTPEPSVIISDEVVALSESDSINVVSLDTLNERILIRQSNLVDSMAVGEILVAPPSSAFPFGAMRRINVIETMADGGVILTTEAAALTDVFEKASFSINVPLTLDDTLKSLTFTNRLTTVLYDNDGNLSTKHDQLRSLGETTSDIRFICDVDIDGSSLLYAKIGFGLNNQTEVELRAGAKASGMAAIPDNIAEAWQLRLLGEWNFTPIVVVVGGLPVTVTPSLCVRAKAKAAIEGYLSTKTSTSLDSEIFVEYTPSNGFQGFIENEPSYTQPIFEAATTVQGSIGMDFEAKVKTAGVFTVGAKLSPVVTAKGTCTTNSFTCPWSLKGKLSLAATVNASVFSRSLFSTEASVVLNEQTFADGEFIPANGSFVDERDGERYDWVKIGEQVWMAEDLRYTAGGTIGYDFFDVESIDNPEYIISTGFRYYDTQIYTDADNVMADEVMDGENFTSNVPSGIRGICPSGWHLPSAGEWEILISNFSSNTHAARLLLDPDVRWEVFGPGNVEIPNPGPVAGETSSGLGIQPIGRLVTNDPPQSLGVGAYGLYASASLKMDPANQGRWSMQSYQIRADNIVRIFGSGGHACRCVKD